MRFPFRIKNYLNRSSISLTKTASPPTFKIAGDVITYTYVLTNTGKFDFNKTVSVTDDKVSLTCPRGSGLVVGASITCSGRYTITAADVAAGQVVNNASAQASQETEYQCIAGGMGGTTMRKTASYTANASASATVTLDANPALTLAKSADPASYSGGREVTYTYTLTNSGDVPLSGPFTITDSRILSVSCPSTAELAPGASLQCSATYLIRRRPALDDHEHRHRLRHVQWRPGNIQHRLGWRAVRPADAQTDFRSPMRRRPWSPRPNSATRLMAYIADSTCKLM